MEPNYYPTLSQAVTSEDEAMCKALIADFYRVSDDRDDTDGWLKFFLDDGTFTVGDETARGKDALRHMRGAMWENVKQRTHSVSKAFLGRFQCPKDDGCVSFVVIGRAEQTREQPSGAARETVDWVGHARLKRDGGRWRFAYYRVYMSGAVDDEGEGLETGNR